MSSNGSGRRRGQQSRYLNGGVSALRRGTCQPSDAVMGTWTVEELERMNSDFVAAMERAFAAGKEAGGVPDYPERISRPPRHLRHP
jgi:hypothetical protein